MRRALATVLVLLVIAGAGAAFVLRAPPTEAAGQLTTYLTGLNWPIALAFSPDGRVFFAERYTGSVRVIDGGVLLPTPYYTLPSTATAGERGLLGLALDPGFPASPWVYAYQTYNDAANGTVYNRIVRIQGSGNVGTSDTVILAMPPLSAATNHNGGVIAFGPDGRLYAVVGENANPSLSQAPASPMGKVLRMNPDGSPPPDNPFYGSLTWDNLVYTYGHRNMFGLAFHPATGRAIVTENGPNCNDEINVLAAGANFGWGPTATCATPPPPPNNTNRDGPSPVLPAWWWGGTICPTNAAVYWGPYFPAWRGDLFIGDCNFRRLHRLDLVSPAYDTVASDDVLLTAPAAILDVEAGPDGAIWFTTPTTIYRYVDVAQSPVASFTATPSRVNPGANVTFDASASTDPDGFIVYYEWDFGDGSNDTSITPATTHAYAAPGLYTVTLTVHDNESYTGSATQSVRVNAAPTARFTMDPPTAYIGVAVTFDASGSTDPDGDPLAFAWDFGDTGTASGAIATHAYAAKGRFTVNLTVTDDLGAAGVAASSVTVGNRPPVITSRDPSGSSLTLSAGQARVFSVVASDPDGDPLTYEWRVNGAAVGGSASSFTFNETATGSFSVDVTVSDREFNVSASWGVVVTAGTGPGPGTTELPVEVWWAAGLVLLAVLAAAILFVVWRRRRREPERPPTPPP